MNPTDPQLVAAERDRLRQEYARRARDVPPDRYAPWQPAEALMRSARHRAAAQLLRQQGVFPDAEDACLEIGCGSLGWLGELIGWGVREQSLHAIELDPARAELARQALPRADVRVGDATDLPWDPGTFRLVVASTVFSSILSVRVRRLVAEAITRALAPGGALLWYDFAWSNPRNRAVRGVGRREVRRLFPELRGPLQRVTLAPPLARLIAPRSWTLATLLEAVPLLRTHLVGVLTRS